MLLSGDGVGHVPQGLQGVGEDGFVRDGRGSVRAASSGMERVGEGDVDGLGVDRADEFVEAVQPGQQVGLAAQDGRVEEVGGQVYAARLGP